MGCNLARGIRPLLMFMWIEQLWVAENLPELFPKFRKKAFMVGFAWKLTTGSVFGWSQWHQSFRDVSELKKTTEDGRMERATRLKLEWWKDDGVKETTNRCVTDEELQAWKMKKAKAESLQSKELGDFGSFEPSALTGLYIHHRPTANEN